MEVQVPLDAKEKPKREILPKAKIIEKAFPRRRESDTRVCGTVVGSFTLGSRGTSGIKRSGCRDFSHVGASTANQ